MSEYGDPGMYDDPWPEVDRQLDIEFALSRLTECERETVLLWSQGYTYQEVADRVGISKRTALRYVKRFRYLLSLFA